MYPTDPYSAPGSEQHLLATDYSRAGLSLMGLVCCLFATVAIRPTAHAATCIEFYDAEKVGEFANEAISESSGIALSRQHDNLLWTHNDSGDSPRIFALGKDGASRGIINLEGASARDWEAMALGPCGDETCLYVGDVGDNNAVRESVALYKVVEPTPRGIGTDQTVTAESLELIYPDGPRDCEGIASDPLTGDILFIEKSFTAEAKVYLLPADAWEVDAQPPFTLLSLGEIDFDTDSLTGGLVTGIDISPSGTELFARTYAAGFHIPLIRDAQNRIIGFEGPRLVNAYDRGQCESVAYDRTGLELWFTCEDVNGPIARSTCKTLQDDPIDRVEPADKQGCATTTTQSPLWLILFYLAWLTRKRRQVPTHA